MKLLPIHIPMVMSTVAQAYTWPSSTDHLESIRYQMSGLFRFGLIDEVNPCGFGTNEPGVVNAAEWVRVAYHDMITHDAGAGTGGVDASIVFEGDRAENIGTAFNHTLGFGTNFYSSRASMADLIALMAVTAVRACGGPSIPFRAGRIDAAEAGPLGVPEPQEDALSLTQKFTKAGFSETDMIKMVACGHTLGGVHTKNFPNITKLEHDKFDNTDDFDNVVVTGYLSDNTTNPLVKGPSLTNSDTRVFSSDNNVTMKALANPAEFQRSCQDILARMLDTVPRGVKLSEPFTPIPVKPLDIQLTLSKNGTLSITGVIRVLETGRKSRISTVKLTYTTGDGKPCSNCVIEAARERFQDGIGFGFDASFSFYSFSTPLVAGISKFNVEVTSPEGKEIHTNNGGGFPVETRVIFQGPQSCLVQQEIVPGKWNLTVTAAIHSSRSRGGVSLAVSERVPRHGIIVPALVPRKIRMNRWLGPIGPSSSSYSLYRVTFALPIASWSTKFDVVSEMDGTIVGDYFKSTGMQNPCGVF